MSGGAFVVVLPGALCCLAPASVRPPLFVKRPGALPLGAVHVLDVKRARRFSSRSAAEAVASFENCCANYRPRWTVATVEEIAAGAYAVQNVKEGGAR